MKNSFFSRFTPKEPKFFPLLKQLSEILLSSSALLIEILGHDSPEKRAEDYKRIKDLEREGDKLTNLILDEFWASARHTAHSTPSTIKPPAGMLAKAAPGG